LVVSLPLPPTMVAVAFCLSMCHSNLCLFWSLGHFLCLGVPEDTSHWIRACPVPIVTPTGVPSHIRRSFHAAGTARAKAWGGMHLVLTGVALVDPKAGWAAAAVLSAVGKWELAPEWAGL
jgi:hypothetical protein